MNGVNYCTIFILVVVEQLVHGAVWSPFDELKLAFGGNIATDTVL